MIASRGHVPNGNIDIPPSSSVASIDDHRIWSIGFTAATNG